MSDFPKCLYFGSPCKDWGEVSHAIRDGHIRTVVVANAEEEAKAKEEGAIEAAQLTKRGPGRPRNVEKDEQ